MAMKGDIDGLNNILSSKAVFSPDIILEEVDFTVASILVPLTFVCE